MGWFTFMIKQLHLNQSIYENDILLPADRDRAGAHSTVLLTELTQKLKETHGNHFSGYTSSWTMWANSIHAAPAQKQAAMLNELPPSHLVHLFHSVPFSDNEIMCSTQHGLQIAGNLNDLYSENVKILREEFTKLKENTFVDSTCMNFD